MGIKFMVDGVADLPKSLSREKILEVPNHITAVKPGEEMLELTDLDADNFDERTRELIADGYVTRTSMPSSQAVYAMTRDALCEGSDVLYLAANESITGSAGVVPAVYLDFRPEEYNGHRAVCMDTQCASTGLGTLVSELVRRQIDNIDEAVKFVRVYRERIAHLFTWEDFTFIKNSGKVKALPAFLGKVFSFCPLGSVEYTDAGRPLVTLSGAIRGKGRFLKVLPKFIKETIDDVTGTITVAHGNDEPYARAIAEAIAKTIPTAKVVMNDDWRCGPVIQAHGGPTSIHVNYLRKRPNTYSESVKILDSCL